MERDSCAPGPAVGLGTVTVPVLCSGLPRLLCANRRYGAWIRGCPIMHLCASAHAKHCLWLTGSLQDLEVCPVLGLPAICQPPGAPHQVSTQKPRWDPASLTLQALPGSQPCRTLPVAQPSCLLGPRLAWPLPFSSLLRAPPCVSLQSW